LALGQTRLAAANAEETVRRMFVDQAHAELAGWRLHNCEMAEKNACSDKIGIELSEALRERYEQRAS
jgi:hypothetical protein